MLIEIGTTRLITSRQDPMMLDGYLKIYIQQDMHVDDLYKVIKQNQDIAYLYNYFDN